MESSPRHLRVADLRRRLAKLTAEVLKTEDELGAVESEEQLKLSATTAPVARVPRTPEEKVALFLELFGTRRSVYPKRWENEKTGKSGYLASSTELFAHAVLLAKAQERKDGSREDDYVAGHPTVDLPSELVKKLDDVVTELAEKRIPANRAFVVRALLRAAPQAPTLAPAVQKYLKEFPSRPRGWAARKARQRGHS